MLGLRHHHMLGLRHYYNIDAGVTTKPAIFKCKLNVLKPFEKNGEKQTTNRNNRNVGISRAFKSQFVRSGVVFLTPKRTYKTQTCIEHFQIKIKLKFENIGVAPLKWALANVLKKRPDSYVRL